MMPVYRGGRQLRADKLLKQLTRNDCQRLYLVSVLITQTRSADGASGFKTPVETSTTPEKTG